MKVITFPFGPLGSNMYVVSLNDSYIIVDPSVSPDRVLDSKKFEDDFLEKVAAILVTHAHFDHVMYLDKWAQRVNCPIYMSKLDEEILKNPDLNCSSLMYADVSFMSHTEKVENIIYVGDYEISIIPTPGHTPGSVCFLFNADGVMFSGDMLFAGAVGRVDLPLGNQKDMNESIELLKTLDDEILVYPGHGYYTKIGLEKSSNPFFRM